MTNIDIAVITDHMSYNLGTVAGIVLSIDINPTANPFTTQTAELLELRRARDILDREIRRRFDALEDSRIVPFAAPAEAPEVPPHTCRVPIHQCRQPGVHTGQLKSSLVNLGAIAAELSRRGDVTVKVRQEDTDIPQRLAFNTDPVQPLPKREPQPVLGQEAMANLRTPAQAEAEHRLHDQMAAQMAHFADQPDPWTPPERQTTFRPAAPIGPVLDAVESGEPWPTPYPRDAVEEVMTYRPAPDDTTNYDPNGNPARWPSGRTDDQVRETVQATKLSSGPYESEPPHVVQLSCGHKVLIDYSHGNANGNAVRCASHNHDEDLVPELRTVVGFLPIQTVTDGLEWVPDTEEVDTGAHHLDDGQ